MKTFFLAALLLLLPVRAWASGCDCGSINAMITMAKMETIQTVNANTTAEAASIRSEILVAAQNIIGTIKSESATIVRAIISLKENNAAMIKGQATAQEATKTEDLYGKAAQPFRALRSVFSWGRGAAWGAGFAPGASGHARQAVGAFQQTGRQTRGISGPGAG